MLTRQTTTENYADPNVGKTPIFRDDQVMVVVDHGYGLSSFMSESGLPGVNSIVEIVTRPVDEFQETLEEAVAPMQRAYEYAQEIENRVIKTGQKIAARTIFPEADPALFLGIDLPSHGKQWQKTEANVQSTYAVKLSQMTRHLKSVAETHQENPTHKAIAQQSAQKAMTVTTIWDKGLKNLSPEEGREAERMKGLISMIFVYLLAGAPKESSETLDKNLVPLLYRHPLYALSSYRSWPQRQFAAEHAPNLTKMILKSSGRDPNSVILPLESVTSKCSEWVESVLKGEPRYDVINAFGLMAKIAPERPGPLGSSPGLAPVMEERDAAVHGRTFKPKASRPGVFQPEEWLQLAKDYYLYLREINGTGV